MGIKEIHIPIYDWDIVVFYNIHEDDDYSKIQDFCNAQLVDMDVINGMLDNVKGKVNNASHICNMEKGVSYIFYNKFVTAADFWKLFPHEIAPDYPKQAETIRYRKKVIVKAKFLVDEKGEVQNITIVQSHKKLGFDDAVISALKKWKFSPIHYNNEIIKVYFQKEFVFESKK